MNGPESVTANFATLPPPIVITTAADDASGTASNCPSASNCSLRDAIAAAAAAGTGNITFDSHVFATPQTITLGSGGGLSVPSNTTIYITGPTTGTGAARKNLVTVSGGGPVFTINTANSSISNLTITGGSVNWEGGGILNNGVLTVSNSTISGNNANGSYNGYDFGSGGGIENTGTLTLINSTVTGNSVEDGGNLEGTVAAGGGIDNQGTLTITNSSVVGNSATGYVFGGISNVYVVGGGINNYGTLTMTNSIVAGNSVNGSAQGNLEHYVYTAGGGIYGSVTGTNNIISGNTNNGSEDDCDSGRCGTNGQNGNLVGAGVQLAPFGKYGRQTKTQPPLPS